MSAITKLAFALTFLAVHVYAQSSIRTLEFKTKSDFKELETEVLACATYVLTSPNSKDDMPRLVALQNIIKWMSGTPDYKFTLDESITKLSNKNSDVLSVYMAALTRFVLENPGQSGDPDAVMLNAFTLLLDYCEDQANKMKKTKELQKAISAKNEGKLKEYLKLS